MALLSAFKNAYINNVKHSKAKEMDETSAIVGNRDAFK